MKKIEKNGRQEKRHTVSKGKMLKLFGQLCRMEDSRLVKEIVFREMEGKTKRGTRRREWLDNISERCNEKIYELIRKA